MPERRLQTSQDLRRYLAGLINRVEGNKIDAGLAKNLTYMTSILLRVIEGSDFEKRLDEIEKRLSMPVIGKGSKNESLEDKTLQS